MTNDPLKKILLPGQGLGPPQPGQPPTNFSAEQQQMQMMRNDMLQGLSVVHVKNLQQCDTILDYIVQTIRFLTMLERNGFGANVNPGATLQHIRLYFEMTDKTDLDLKIKEFDPLPPVDEDEDEESDGPSKQKSPVRSDVH